MTVRVYVEGGGDRRDTMSACRRGFVELFKKVLGELPSPRVVVCGSREDAYRDFKTAVAQRTGAALLLVDAEEAVAPSDTPKAHLARRDRWEWPAEVGDDDVHLFVQTMEAWFLADRESLARFYGQGFRAKALPPRTDVEAVGKADVFKALRAATRDTDTKREYHKTRHGFLLLTLLDPALVRAGSAYAARLFDVLTVRCGAAR